MSDYLWDKTGEPDEEIERLEELLGGYAHEPRALDLPAEAAPRTPFVGRPRYFRPALFAAAAALLLMMLVGAALVLLRQNGADVNQHSASTNPQITPAKEKPAAPPEEPEPSFVPVKRDERAGVGNASGKKTVPPDSSASSRKKRRQASPGVNRQALQVAARPGPPAPTPSEQQAAKEQLVYALRLASAKLNEVRKMTRGQEATPRQSFDERNKIR